MLIVTVMAVTANARASAILFSIIRSPLVETEMNECHIRDSFGCDISATVPFI
jgi:hypothetical protein